jgi:hypothetical protein
MEFAHFGRLRDEVGVRRLGIVRLDLNHGLERLGAEQFLSVRSKATISSLSASMPI